jgi:dUTP pyrophosphatase
MRKFEKISFDQFVKDVKDDRMLYDEYKLPVRKTKYSAGYDFLAIEDFSIKPGEIKKIPTGVKALYPTDETLMLFVRSSMGFKWNVRMCNQVGIIDSDFYNNSDNEGHMWFALQNEGDKEFKVKKGESFGQGLFMKYLTVDDEEEVQEERNGGIGSTNK